MTDRAKVIRGLDICINSIMRDCPPCPPGCPYYEQCTTKNEDGMTPVFLPLLKDALELLKEQEPVEPKRIDGKRNHFIKCGNCNCDLMTGFQFCPHCGKEVKWECQSLKH